MLLLKDYQKQRITSFIFPYDYLGASWSQNQTKISIGSGQVFGQGLAKGSQVQFGFLPEPHTDFIFSVITSKALFVGAEIIILNGDGIPGWSNVDTFESQLFDIKL